MRLLIHTHMLTERQTALLTSIIIEHIRTAQAVASEFLVDRCKLECSPATVRSEMLALDEQGYLKKTHTSSGRIPTEKAYQHYVDYEKKPAVLLERQKQKLQEAIEEGADERAKVKGLLRTMADISDEFILTAFAENDFYYTGLTNLFSKPEFREQSVVCNISAIIDHLDSRLKELFPALGVKCHVFVGRSNPIDSHLSFIAVKVAEEGPLIALLGPMRMRYSANVALIEYCKELLL